jgi:UDP-2,4-diacetamido-2,4,6-trideoxy-beta-L-altropyranose hydrolase
VCDATFDSGNGHVMRQITLGVALKSLGLNPVLFCFSIPDGLVARAQAFGITVLKREYRCDSPELSKEILLTDCAIAVFDGYEFTEETISNIFDHNVRVVLVDDNGDLANFPCHLILNQNLHADAAIYTDNESSPRLLLGLSWALIRPEVVAQIDKITKSEKSGILLSIGGTDHLGITPVLNKALKAATNEEVVTTSGLAAGTSLSPMKMALAMSHAKIGIIACGTTMWEAICLKLPFVGLITAENQVRASESLIRFPTVHTIDVRESLNVAEIVDETLKTLQQQELSTEFSQDVDGLIDGLGSVRVAHEINKLLAEYSEVN